MADGHYVEWDYTPSTDTHSARCECGWEASVGGGQMASLEDSIDAHWDEVGDMKRERG